MSNTQAGQQPAGNLSQPNPAPQASQQQTQSQAPGTPLTFAEESAKPWKYIGYRYFSRFLTADRDHLLLRRFDNLHGRVLLRLQHQLSTLEDALLELDVRLSAKDAPDRDNGSFERDDKDRASKIDEIQICLRQYDEAVLAYSSLRSRPRAPEVDIQNIRNWALANRGAIADKELRWIEAKRDLFNVVSSQKSPMRRYLERSDYVRSRPWFVEHDLIVPGTPYEVVEAREVTYVDDRHMDRTVDMLISSLGFVMLVAPLWTLSSLESRTAQLGVITAFSGFFLFLLQVVTLARPFETLAAMAGYAAVLMIFMQINVRPLSA